MTLGGVILKFAQVPTDSVPLAILQAGGMGTGMMLTMAALIAATADTASAVVVAV